MELLFFISQQESVPTDVKVIGIMAIGDICLMTEDSFKPYFDQSMTVLIAAGQMSIQPIDPSLSSEEKQTFHSLRQAVVDAFMSMINGLKAPET